jgi:hypothetical protein
MTSSRTPPACWTLSTRSRSLVLRSMTCAAGSSRRLAGIAAARGEPVYGICHVLRAGRERFSPRQQDRLDAVFAARPDHVAVEVAYPCAQDV